MGDYGAIVVRFRLRRAGVSRSEVGPKRVRAPPFSRGHALWIPAFAGMTVKIGGAVTRFPGLCAIASNFARGV